MANTCPLPRFLWREATKDIAPPPFGMLFPSKDTPSLSGCSSSSPVSDCWFLEGYISLKQMPFQLDIYADIVARESCYPVSRCCNGRFQSCPGCFLWRLPHHLWGFYMVTCMTFRFPSSFFSVCIRLHDTGAKSNVGLEFTPFAVREREFYSLKQYRVYNEQPLVSV